MWRVDNGVLFVTGGGETEAIPYALQGATLTLTANGLPVVLSRAGAVAPAAAPSTDIVATPPPVAAGKATRVDTKDPLAQLFLSSPWCNFRFNKTTGYSSKTRVQYFVDGTYQSGARGEGDSSGAGGIMASQSDTGSTGKWTTHKGQLLMTIPPSDENPSPPADLVPVPLVVNKNSNGAPILLINGTEFVRCE